MTLHLEALRRPAVAGMFYPADPDVLRELVDSLMAHAAPQPGAAKALVVPHAGYVYSGPVAATAYAALRADPASKQITRVVLLGPAHRVAVGGLALPGARALQTPLGTIPVDDSAWALPERFPAVTVSARVHAQEHSLEVHLPFLQRALGPFTLIPLCVGDADTAEVADVMDACWGGQETLIVVSTDLSHYLPYAQARRVDQVTAEAVVARATEIDHERACGATPLNGLLEVARRRELTVELLDLRNSGDTAGGRDQVVGYGSFRLTA